MIGAQSHVHIDQSHFEKGQFLEPMKFTPKGWNWEKRGGGEAFTTVLYGNSKN